jgi:uncharacterized membrane protein
MGNLFKIDERTQSINGQVSFYTLMLTHIGLGIALVYKAYILNLPPAETRDISIILLFSTYGYWAMRIYFQGDQPVLSWKRILKIYILITIAFDAVLIIWRGLPRWSEWRTTWLPGILGPAVIVGAYWLATWLGQRRMMQDLEK